MCNCKLNEIDRTGQCFLERKVGGFWEVHTLHESVEDAAEHMNGGFAEDYPGDEARITLILTIWDPLIVMQTRNESGAVEVFGERDFLDAKELGFI